MPTTLELIVSIFLVSASRIACALGTETGIRQQQSWGLSKTVFSEKMRAVFLVGLEGAGHHYLRSAINNAYPGFANQIEMVSAWNFGWQASMSENLSGYIDSLRLAREQVQSYALEEDGLQEGQGKVVHFGKFISYPYLGGPNKVFQYTDLRMLADFAEEEGVDLRIVYLKRSAQDMVIADTVHRNFQSHLGDAAEASSEERFIEYLKVLFTDMAVMHSMLVELDPAFVLCHDYDTLGDVSQASAIASFISPNENMAQLMKLSLLDSVEERNTAGKSIVPFEGVRVIVDRMQSKLDTFESAYCRN